jgi:hypothetical protein
MVDPFFFIRSVNKMYGTSKKKGLLKVLSNSSKHKIHLQSKQLYAQHSFPDTQPAMPGNLIAQVGPQGKRHPGDLERALAEEREVELQQGRQVWVPRVLPAVAYVRDVALSRLDVRQREDLAELRVNILWERYLLAPEQRRHPDQFRLH